MGNLSKQKGTTYFDFLYLCLKTTNIGVTFCWGLVKLHDTDHRVRVILQDTNDS